MNSKKLHSLLIDHINNPRYDLGNFWLAVEYQNLSQYAGAISFYLRCAELSTDKNLVYECLLKIWECINKTGDRPYFEETQLLSAIAYFPERAEGYFLLSEFYAQNKKWMMAYNIASIGEKAQTFGHPPLRSVDYMFGRNTLLFQKSYTASYVGKIKEAEELSKQLILHPDTSNHLKSLCKTNLKYFGYSSEYVRKLSLNTISKESIDIVLQGQCTPYTVETAKIYSALDFVNLVVISCWEGDSVDIIPHNKIKLIKTKIPTTPGTGNVNLQILSSYQGVLNSTASYVMKVRSDQRYTVDSLKSIFNYFIQNKYLPSEISVSSFKPKGRIFTRGIFETFLFHPNDHLFLGYREDLLELFNIPPYTHNISDIIDLEKKDLWKYYDFFIRGESYIGAHYCANFDLEVNKYLLQPHQYLHDNAPKWAEAFNSSSVLIKKVFKALPKSTIDLVWDKHNWNGVPFEEQYHRYGERWDEDGF